MFPAMLWIVPCDDVGVLSLETLMGIDKRALQLSIIRFIPQLRDVKQQHRAHKSQGVSSCLHDVVGKVW